MRKKIKMVTLNDINDVIEVFENFLKDRNIRIPTSDMEMIVSGGYSPETIEDNDAVIYGDDYSNLQDELLDLFEQMEKDGKVNNVVNSWEGEVKEWN